MRKAVYAAYKGDEFIDLGTKKYLADRLGVTEKAIELFNSPSYKARPSQSKTIVIRLEDDEDG